jgi:hypothetical protein
MRKHKKHINNDQKTWLSMGGLTRRVANGGDSAVFSVFFYPLIMPLSVSLAPLPCPSQPPAVNPHRQTTFAMILPTTSSPNRLISSAVL